MRPHSSVDNRGSTTATPVSFALNSFLSTGGNAAMRAALSAMRAALSAARTGYPSVKSRTASLGKLLNLGEGSSIKSSIL